MENMKRNVTIVVNRNLANIWIKRTPEELSACRERDVAAGRFHDDAGEPILYSPYFGWGELETDTLEVTIRSLRPKWEHWLGRPKGLTSGWCESLQREVLIASK